MSSPVTLLLKGNLTIKIHGSCLLSPENAFMISKLYVIFSFLCSAIVDVVETKVGYRIFLSILCRLINYNYGFSDKLA